MGEWERKTGKSIYSMKDISAYQQADFLDLAYFAYKRDAAGKPTKSQEVWELSVEEMTIGDDSPKVSKPEASTD